MVESRNVATLPALLLSLCGPFLSISLTAFESVSYPIVPCLPLQCISRDDRYKMERMAKCFRTLKNCVNDLTTYYQSPEFPPTDLSDAEIQQLAFPYPRELTIGACKVKFEYLREVEENKLVFLVKVTSFTVTGAAQDASEDRDKNTLEARKENNSVPLAVNDLFVIKFAKTYCPEAHRICAEFDAAPVLYSISDRLPGGWFMVAMEWLGDDTLPLGEQDMIWGKVRTTLQKLHNANLVHGDLRSENIRVIRKPGQRSEEFRVCFIDFDWSGMNGVARYPGFMNRVEVNWHKTAVDFAPLLFEHDVWFLDELYALRVQKIRVTRKCS